MIVVSSILVSDPEIMGGLPVFTGTRVPVDTLTSYLKAGDSIDEFLSDFPSVKRIQVESYLSHAEEVLIVEAKGQ